MPVKLVSFDVWKTLIDPNPEFGTARKLFLRDALDLPEHVIEAAYREIKDGADNDAESAGIGYTHRQVYAKLLAALDQVDNDWMIQHLQRRVSNLFAKYPPKVREGVPETLQALQAAGLSLSIASNTNFVDGRTLRGVVLDRLGVNWKFALFSDEIAIAKPHPLMWRAIQEYGELLADAAPSEILHVGDNPICDGKCVDAGLQFHLIQQPADLTALQGLLLNAQAA